jgi:hypothetical protein
VGLLLKVGQGLGLKERKSFFLILIFIIESNLLLCLSSSHEGSSIKTWTSLSKQEKTWAEFSTLDVDAL